jgi:cytochrome c oxidase subunit 2
MKKLIKIIAVAAALGLAPAAALGQAAAPAPAAPAATSAAPTAAPTPSPAPSAAQPAGGAQPEQVSGPDSATGRPSDATVAQSAPAAARATPSPGIGQADGRWYLQEQFSPIGRQAAWFHNWVLMPAITVISILVLLLLIYVVIRYRRAAHPNPSRTTHNTLLEIVWTLVPVLILVVIAVPSIGLLSDQYSPPRADLTVKVIGNQWYWEYEYPDHGVQFVSNILTDEEARRRGEPRLLGVDERMVVPVNATVKVIVTSNDVVHSFGVPAFWVKMDAVPGRLNETWFQADRPGLYYGQCYELCGARHAYMPIAVEVVSQEQFAAWVAGHGGQMPGAQPAAAAAPVQPGLTAGQATETSPAPAGVNPGTATPPVTNQAARNPEEDQ